jgi:hypothetical protein
MGALDPYQITDKLEDALLDVMVSTPISISPPDLNTARNATLSVVLTCVDPDEGGSTHRRLPMQPRGPSASGGWVR